MLSHREDVAGSGHTGALRGEEDREDLQEGGGHGGAGRRVFRESDIVGEAVAVVPPPEVGLVPAAAPSSASRNVS